MTDLLPDPLYTLVSHNLTPYRIALQSVRCGPDNDIRNATLHVYLNRHDDARKPKGGFYNRPCLVVPPGEVLSPGTVRRLLTNGMCARCWSAWPDHQPGTDERSYCAACCPECQEDAA